ncbi:DUF4173 domain-containing protein [uncultured Tateyamaria sp.]|uniref:DUF4153 domain-containing protein n=1 Tax=uncultured Tateyamaria sp. TaxID=455651 RepID=UPI00260DDBE6|nr:DUF4173 domain-containing protein [uncultured Tateyamaria sp.]
MTTRIFRGVPLSMQQDGWWLDGPKEPSEDRQRSRRRDGIKAGLLVALIACGDMLVWSVVPALSFALLALLIVLAGLALAWPRLSTRARFGIGAGAVLAVLPLIELVQPLSVLIALLGLSGVCAALAGLARGDLLRGALRLWWVAPAQTVSDAALGAQRLGHIGRGPIDIRALLLTWALPVAATALFALLLIGANPVLDQALLHIMTWHPPVPNMWRLWFWVTLGILIWPLLVAPAMRERLRARRATRATVRRQGIINAGSVARSLIAFNALFAVQTVMDVLFLYGNVGLPEGISPATYAHRGAYPLLVTALLAGLFAVLARPHLAGRPVLRWLMLLWLAQTLALVAASLFRLDAYVDVYGLTRLRVAAYIWMGLVAAGLGIVLWQIWRDKPAAWMLLRSGVLGAGVLYVTAFINIDGLIATHNLTHPVVEDRRTICALSEGALPALHRHLDIPPHRYCASSSPHLSHPTDWREWGFRNWRVRRSLVAMTTDAHAP